MAIHIFEQKNQWNPEERRADPEVAICSSLKSEGFGANCGWRHVQVACDKRPCLRVVEATEILVVEQIPITPCHEPGANRHREEESCQYATVSTPPDFYLRLVIDLCVRFGNDRGSFCFGLPHSLSTKHFPSRRDFLRLFPPVSSSTGAQVTRGQRNKGTGKQRSTKALNH